MRRRFGPLHGRKTRRWLDAVFELRERQARPWLILWNERRRGLAPHFLEWKKGCGLGPLLDRKRRRILGPISEWKKKRELGPFADNEGRLGVSSFSKVGEMH